MGRGGVQQKASFHPSVSRCTRSLSILFLSFPWTRLFLPTLVLAVSENGYSSPDLTTPFSSHVSNHVRWFVSLTSNSPVREFQAINWFLISISQSQVVIKTSRKSPFLVRIVGGVIPNSGLCTRQPRPNVSTTIFDVKMRSYLL